jgi:hypothetical protein
MAAAEQHVEEYVFRYTTDGVDQTRAKVDQLGSSLDKLGTAQDRSASSSDRNNAASDRAARAKAAQEAAAAKHQRQIEAENRALAASEAAQNAAAAATGGLTASQMKAIDAYAAATKASNDNAASVSKQGEVFKAAGKTIAEHPVLVLAASVAAARGLAGLATAASGYLGAASVSTAAFAEGASGMGAAVVTGAALAARGLAGLSTGAEAAAGGLATYAEKVAGFTTATGLLSRGLSLIPPLFVPILAAFVAFEVGSAVIGKANSDLQKLIDIGMKAQQLDVGAGFLKSFESLGPKIQATTEQMDAALSKAASFVKDQWGQTNNLTKTFNDINATGVAGANGLQATTQADLASTTQQRIQAALAGMKELHDLGLDLVAQDVGGKVFGPDFVERLRTSGVTLEQFVANMQAASEKQILDQGQVERAVALNRAIEDTKQAIADAWAVNIDFSSAGILLNEIWLKILQAVLAVVQAMNDGIAAVTAFGSAVASSIGGAFDAVYSKATAVLAQLGVINKQQAATATTTPPVDGTYGPQQPTITARQFPYTFGPTAPTGFQKPAAAAKQAKEAADTAISSYDNLIKRTQDHIDELTLEADSVGKDAAAVIKLKLAHDLARAAQKDGTEVTEAMRAEWDRLGDTLATSTENLKKAKFAFEGIKDGQRELASDFTQFIEDITVGGQKLDQALQSLAKTLSSSALKAIISGEGPLAGILGTAGDERGALGGLLGGKLNLGSLFGGGSEGAVQGPTLSGKTLDEDGGFFSNLFDGDKISKALSGGAESGIGSALSNALKPTKAGGGVLSSPLGQGLTSAAVGGSLGYSTQSPLIGAAGGALAGFAAAGPIGAVVGGAAGILGGLFGASEAKKQAKKQLQEKIQAMKDALTEARPQIEALDLAFTGGALGTVGKNVTDAQSQAAKAIKTASDGGDQALADKLMADFKTYVARQVAIFADGFKGTMAEVQAGFGTNGPFATAVSSVQALGEALKGFVADAGRLTDPAAQMSARAAAVQGALGSLNPAPTLSTTQTELARIQGTAAGLNQVLKDLGLSSEQAAAAISSGVDKAIDGLRDKFTTDLQAKINTAQGKGYLNDASDLIKEVQGLQADAGSVGGDLGQVQTYFTAAAQKIVDNSQLVGDAFNQLVAAFPQLAGQVHAFSADGQKSTDELAAAAAQALSEIQDRKRSYEDRAFAVNFSDNSLATKLTTFDRSAEWEQWTEMAKGGQALDELIATQVLERNKLIADYNEAVRERQLTFDNRTFAANNDTSTLAGQLAAYDRQAQQERADEIKNGGEAIVGLETAQAAERLKIIRDFTKQAQTAFDSFADTIKKFLDSLVTGSNSPLSPQDRLAAAQSQYDQQLALARGGDQTAIGSITTYAQTLLDASKAFYASSQAFQDTFKSVQDTLSALPVQIGVDGFMKQYADGGWVSGAGTSTSDSIIARLSNGEFVMSAAAAGRYGPILEAMNDDRPMAVAAPPRAPTPSGSQGAAAMLDELRALRAEVAALRGDVQEGNDIADAGHLGTIQATKDVGAGIAKGNRTASRREVAA